MKLSFPTQLTTVNAHISVLRIGDAVAYYKDDELIFIHDSRDKVAFRFIACQLLITNSAKQTEMRRVFKISRSSLSGWVNGYKKGGAKSLCRITKSGLTTGIVHKKHSRRPKRTIENIIGETSSKRNVFSKIYL